MTTTATSPRRTARRSRRSSVGHSGDRSDAQRGPLGKTRLPINTPPFGRNDPLCYRILADQGARSTCRNSHTEPAALKSP